MARGMPLGLMPGMGYEDRTRIKRLDGDTLHELHEQTGRVLHAAIERGANPGGLPDSFLLPHRRGERTVPGATARYRRRKLRAAPAYYCPACQPKE